MNPIPMHFETLRFPGVSKPSIAPAGLISIKVREGDFSREGAEVVIQRLEGKKGFVNVPDASLWFKSDRVVIENKDTATIRIASRAVHDLTVEIISVPTKEYDLPFPDSAARILTQPEVNNAPNS